MIRVAVVDEHPVARRGFAVMCQAEPDIEVVAAVPDPAGLPAGLAGAVVLGDPYPLGEPSWQLGEVRKLFARQRVLVVSGSGAAPDVLAAMQAGARGYLMKTAGPSACVAAIRAVAAGRVHLADELATTLAAHRDGGPAIRGALSGRERQTLAYIARGFTHQQTATRMGVSKATVDTYVGRIRGKLRLGNKAELALAALRYVEPRHSQTVTQGR